MASRIVQTSAVLCGMLLQSLLYKLLSPPFGLYLSSNIIKYTQFIPLFGCLTVCRNTDLISLVLIVVFPFCYYLISESELGCDLQVLLIAGIIQIVQAALVNISLFGNNQKNKNFIGNLNHFETTLILGIWLFGLSDSSSYIPLSICMTGKISTILGVCICLFNARSYIIVSKKATKISRISPIKIVLLLMSSIGRGPFDTVFTSPNLYADSDNNVVGYPPYLELLILG
jgi:hypothetical protein